MNIRNIDLNLLVVFDALMQERNVSRAAKKVFLSQPATSNALNRLRSLLDDPILVKTGQGMQPSERALAMHEEVRDILQRVEMCLQKPQDFSPATSQKHFVISGSEFVELLLMPPLIKRLRQVAPGVSVAIHMLEQEFPCALMERGEVDLAICIKDEIKTPAQLITQDWFEEPLLCMVAENSAYKNSLSEQDYINCAHLYESPQGAATVVDRWFSARDKNRHYVYEAKSYITAAAVVEQSDLVATFPKRVAEHLIGKAKLKSLQPPESLPNLVMQFAWHSKDDKSPALQWLKQQLSQVADELGLLASPQ